MSILGQQWMKYAMAIALLAHVAGRFALAHEPGAVIASVSASTTRAVIGTGAEQRLVEWRSLLERQHLPANEKIIAVNAFFNRIAQKADEVVWGKVDHWATPKELLTAGAGDCEDLAIAKYVTLVAMGIQPTQLTLAVARAFLSRSRAIERHMVLIYREPASGTRWILDNLRAEILAPVHRADLTLIGEVAVPARAVDQMTRGWASAVSVRISSVDEEAIVARVPLATLRR